MKQINARGDLCPLPVVKTKEAIKEMLASNQSGKLQVLVDNEIAVQNLEKMAVQKGYEVHSSQLAEREFRVELTIQPAKVKPQDDVKHTVAAFTQAAPNLSMAAPASILVAIGSDRMGSGPDELGQVLMKGFLFSLTKQDVLPKKIIFYNTGAQLTCDASEALADLRYLEAQGVQILTCGTCLNYQSLEDKLRVGAVTNMYEIAEAMLTADKVIQP